MRSDKPQRLKIDASTACQLRCPACATTQGRTGASLGTGFLKPDNFERLLNENPSIQDIELSNWGEIFLNPHLLSIMKIAHERNVALTADNGVNFNTVASDVLDGLVDYQFRRLTIALDGASEGTYGVYRRRGSFGRVIENIVAVNDRKRTRNSSLPKLTWQFVPFEHNQHEIAQAREMARTLDMDFYVKLAWDNLFDSAEEFAPVTDKEAVRRQTGVGAADRREYFEKFGDNYLQKSICAQLWQSPQINWDGRLLGCCINYWGDFGNVFEEGLDGALNGDRMTHAKQMLMGQAPAREDIPCSRCMHYLTMKGTGRWLRPNEVIAD